MIKKLLLMLWLTPQKAADNRRMKNEVIRAYKTSRSIYEYEEMVKKIKPKTIDELLSQPQQ